MRLCDEKDSLHGRVFFLREKCGKNRESDKFVRLESMMV